MWAEVWVATLENVLCLLPSGTIRMFTLFALPMLLCPTTKPNYSVKAPVGCGRCRDHGDIYLGEVCASLTM